MFGFLNMAGNYESRKVARFDKGKMFISTAMVTDGDHPYETAVCHPEYNSGKHVIVEAYDSKTDAQKGHDKWVKKMTSKKLPASLTDCANAELGQLCESFGGKMTFKRKKTA